MNRQRACAGLLLAALAAPAGALQIELRAGSIELPGQVEPLRDARVACSLRGDARGGLHCEAGQAAVQWRGQTLQARFAGDLDGGGDWRLRDARLSAPALDLQADASARHGVMAASLRSQVRDLAWLAPLAPLPPGLALAGGATLDAQITRAAAGRWSGSGTLTTQKVQFAEPSGRYAAEQLDARLTGSGTVEAGRLQVQVDLDAHGGQAYAEPVFLDLAAAPARVQARIDWDRAAQRLALDDIAVDQAGRLRAHGWMLLPAGGAPDADLQLDDIALAGSFQTYTQPFLAGTRFEQASLDGRATATVQVRGGQVQALEAQLRAVAVGLPAFELGLSGIDGPLRWSRTETRSSSLAWSGGHLAKLTLGAARLELESRDRDVRLLAPLRLPLAGGALRVQELALTRAGAADMGARFDAELEPLDLAALCRAFGWPEFGGQLSGRLPGLSLVDRELRLDGALQAQAFDGRIALENLRVRDPLGRVPRVEADLRLRNLDLAAVTGAFSFGRIEGRLDGDVENLRLLDWQPVAFDARLGTPPGDDSRHRISQRAIDNLSSLGGGPSGVLSRGALRFFEDFAYARIGWSCRLRDGVCTMGGLGPARDGGYVLVQGRWLPRIDVVGHQTEVDWTTFVGQLRAARSSQGVEVR